MNLKIIGAVAALAVAMPFSMATPSAAQGRGGGGGFHAGSPGGGHFGGARGFGGARSFGGGGGFRAAPAMRTGAGFSGPRFGATRPGGMRPVAGGGWRGGPGWHGHRGGWHRRGGFYPGFFIGGALAAPYAFGYPYDYSYYDDDYYYGAPTVTVAADPGSVAYCQRRFKSYDVRTGTYLGYDGLRHPCP